MQREVLETTPSEELTILAVWEPILRTDNVVAARKATTLFSDARVENYWAPDQTLGRTFQGAIDLKTEPAWDVYLVYPREAEWTGTDPPRPEYFMHQLGGRLPDANRLDGVGLARSLEAALSRE